MSSPLTASPPQCARNTEPGTFDNPSTANLTLALSCPPFQSHRVALYSYPPEAYPANLDLNRSRVSTKPPATAQDSRQCQPLSPLAQFDFDEADRQYAFDDDFSSVDASDSTAPPGSSSGPGCIPSAHWRKRDPQDSSKPLLPSKLDKSGTINGGLAHHRRFSRSTKTTGTTGEKSECSDSACVSRLASEDVMKVDVACPKSVKNGLDLPDVSQNVGHRSSFAGIVRRGVSTHSRSKSQSRPRVGRSEFVDSNFRKRSISFSSSASPLSLRRRTMFRHGRRRRGLHGHGQGHGNGHGNGHSHGHNYRHGSCYGHIRGYGRSSCLNEGMRGSVYADDRSDGSGAGEGAGAIGGGRGSGRVIPEISVGTVFKPRPEGSILRDWRDGVRKGQEDQSKKTEDECKTKPSRFSRGGSRGGGGDHQESGQQSTGNNVGGKSRFLWPFARLCGGYWTSGHGNGTCAGASKEGHAGKRDGDYVRRTEQSTECRRQGLRMGGRQTAPAPKQPVLRGAWLRVDQSKPCERKTSGISGWRQGVEVDDLIHLGACAMHWKTAGKLDAKSAAALRRVV